MKTQNPEPPRTGRRAVASVRVTYADGFQQYAQFQHDSDYAACELIGGAGTVSAGRVHRRELAKALAEEVLGGSVGERVCAELEKRGIGCSWEYPGWVSIKLAGGFSWAFGNSNATWSGDLHNTAGYAIASEDIGMLSDSEEVSAIADAIADLVVRESAERPEIAYNPTVTQVVAAFNLAMRQEDIVANGDQEECEDLPDCEPDRSGQRAFALAYLAGYTCPADLEKATEKFLMNAKEAFLLWASKQWRPL